MKSKEEAPLAPDFESILQNNGGKMPFDGVIAVKAIRSGVKLQKEKRSHKSGGTKRGKDNHSHNLIKRRRY